MSRKLAKIPGSFELNQEAKAERPDDFDAFHNLPEDLKKKQIESFRFANSVFPFYIPDEHHEINLSQRQNSKGEYWGTVAHFLLCNKAHGIPLWKTFEAQIQSSDTAITCRPHISTNMTNRILQHIPINDGGDLNFVFQNWVLIQLPFQPILLFQWLTYAVYLLTSIEIHMAKLYYVPFPEKLKPQLLRLHKMLKTAHRNIGFLFDYLRHQTRSEPDIFVGNLKVFEEILQEVTVFFEFWLLTNGKEYLSNLLKVQKENLKSNVKQFELKRGRMALKKRNFLFNFDFWRAPGPLLKIFGDSIEELVRKCDTEVNLQDRNFHTNNLLESFFEPDVVRRIDKNSMLLDDDFLKIQRKMFRLDEIYLSIFTLCIERGDSGILGPVLSNNVAAEYWYTKSKFYAWMFKNYKVLPKEDPYSTDNLREFAVENIIPLIEEIEERNRNEYSLLEVLNSIKRDNGPNQELEFPSRFEARIRTIVLDCVESYLRLHNFQNFEEKKNEVLRDWHVVQYLLPCFVALYVKICESNDPEHKNLQNWYAKFLDKLICTYEEDGIRKSSWTNVLQDINSFPALRESCLNNNHEDLSNFFTEVSNHFVERIMRGASKDARNHLHCCRFFRAFFEVIQKKTGDLDENDVVATEASAYWNWLMWDFFSRMKHALEVAE